MRSHPTGGYVVPVESFIEALRRAGHLEQALAFANAVDDLTIRDLVDALPADFVNAGLPAPAEAFILSQDNGDEGGGLEYDTWYLLFDEGSLFVKTPTPAYSWLADFGAPPEEHSWVVFG